MTESMLRDVSGPTNNHMKITSTNRFKGFRKTSFNAGNVGTVSEVTSVPRIFDGVREKPLPFNYMAPLLNTDRDRTPERRHIEKFRAKS